MPRYPTNGTYIKNAIGNGVYEVVGGSALPVSSWGNVGGAHPYVNVDSYDISTYLPDYPSDGTFIKNAIGNGVYEVVGGAALPVSSWGNVGGSRPYTSVDPWAINHSFRQYPADGTFVKNAIGNGVYIIAGGSALAVSNWANVGGSRAYTNIDPWAINNYLLQYPQDSTLVVGYQSQREYKIVDQAPVYQPVPVGSPTAIDDWALANQLGATE